MHKSITFKMHQNIHIYIYLVKPASSLCKNNSLTTIFNNSLTNKNIGIPVAIIKLQNYLTSNLFTKIKVLSLRNKQ
jgi:hypothetical protein